jgi:protein CpxP
MYKTFIRFGPAAVLGLGMMLSVAQAQDQPAGPPAGRRGPMDPEQQILRLKQALKLSDDQVSQIRPILADSQKQAMAARTDSTLSQDDRRAKMMSIRQDAETKIKGVLTDAQKTQYDDMMAKRMQMMQQRQQQGGNPNQ